MSSKINQWFLVGLLALGPMATEAQPQVASCDADPRYRQFDFWVGEWEVFVNDQKAGDNVVSREESGCLIVERWTDVNGGTGQSYNYFQPDSETWRQVWVSKAMLIDYSGGLVEDGSIELTGWMVNRATGDRTELKGRWTPLGDGTVRQHFEQLDAESKKWQGVFTGIYRPKAKTSS